MQKKQKITFLGKVKSDKIVIDYEDFGAVSAWKKTYDTVLGNIMG